MASGKDVQKAHEHDLCDTCSKIDFQSLLDAPGTRLFRISFTAGCVLCELLLPLLPKQVSEQGHRFGPDHILSSVSYFGHCQAWKYNELEPAQVNVTGAQDSVILKLRPGLLLNNWVFCCPRIDSGASLFQARAVQSICNYAAVKSWLKNCGELHDCVTGKTRTPVEGMKLIDCNDLSIVPAGSSSPWVALSYVWGSPVQPSDIVLDTRDDEYIPLHLLDSIPQTVQDAITVTRELGYQFLWVDEFCIDQRHETHRADQIKQMDRIYQGADLTIVAAAGEDKHHGLPGVGNTNRSKSNVVKLKDCTIINLGPDPVRLIKESKWQSRGWTLQEGLLSQRLLVFTETQISYHCQRAAWQEGLNGPECIPKPHEIDWSEWPIHIDLFGGERRHNEVHHDDLQLYTEYFSMITAFKKRKLSHQADQFDAFAGILTHMSKRLPARHHLWGLPFIPDAFEDCVEAHLLLGLSWYHLDVNTQRCRKYPSWTWADWTGQFSWAASSDWHRWFPCYATFRLVSLDIPDDGASFLPTSFVQQISHERREHDVSPTTHMGSITIEAPFIPASCVYEEALLSWSSISIRIGHYVSQVQLDLRPSILEQLPTRLADKEWGLCLLGWARVRGMHCTLFILLVEWLDKSRAERLDSLMFDWSPEGGDDIDVFVAGWEHFQVTLV